MKKHKIFGVILIVIVGTFLLPLYVKAASCDSNESENRYFGTADNVLTRSDDSKSATLKVKAGSFTVIAITDTGKTANLGTLTASAPITYNATANGTVSFWLFLNTSDTSCDSFGADVNNYNNLNKLTSNPGLLNNKNYESNIKCKESYGDNDSTSNCTTVKYKHGTFYWRFYTDFIVKASTPATIPNTNSSTGLCASFKSNNYDQAFKDKGLSEEDYKAYGYSSNPSFFQSKLPDCFADSVSVNLSKNALAAKIVLFINANKALKMPSQQGLSAIPTGATNVDNPKDGKAESCDPFATVEPTSKVTDENYYLSQNTKIYYHTKVTNTTYYTDADNNTKTITDGTSAPQDAKYKVSCTRTCQEIVTIQYGPPVASAAGACFQYKVKIKSKVECKGELSDTDLPTKPNVCLPQALCGGHSKGDKLATQGGPNEDFDSCISSCDGGKYTQSCINKCYKKVYKSTSTNNSASNLALTYEDGLVTKMANAGDATCGIKNQYTAKKIDESGFDIRHGGVNDTAISQIVAAINDPSSSTKGKYYWDENGAINWEPGKCYWDLIGSFYLKSGMDMAKRTLYNMVNDASYGGYDIYTGGYYIKSTSGINGFKAGIDCNETCKWVGCSKSDYLDDTEAENAYEAAMQTYTSAMTDCKSAASCSETETTADAATFSMKTYYSSKTSSKSQWFNFPYSDKNGKNTETNDPAIIPKQSTTGSNTNNCSKNNVNISDSNGNLVSATCPYLNSANTSAGTNSTDCLKYDAYTIKNKTGKIIIDQGGVCYGCNDTNNGYHYMTEITYPGTWERKNGEISYTEPKNSKVWQFVPNQYCTPLDSATVNSEWLDWAVLANKDQTFAKSCYSAEEIKKALGTSTSYDDKNINWNIRAEITNFGYFKWKFDVSCFYALSGSTIVPVTTKDNKICDCTNDSSKGIEKCASNTANSYGFRNVDSTDIFPTTSLSSGSTKTRKLSVTAKTYKTGNESTTESSTTKDLGATGRTPAYNWSAYAINVQNSNYMIVPPSLIKAIQTRGINDSLYSTSNEGTYLDYEFILDKTTLLAIKEYNKNKKYTDYNGDFDTSYVATIGTKVYRSNLFRNTKAEQVISNNNIKKLGILGCNNGDGTDGRSASLDNCEHLETDSSTTTQTVSDAITLKNGGN
jgi:hypothetical protein